MGVSPFLNDTLLIVSLAESSILPFMYSDSQAEIDKIEMNMKRMQDFPEGSKVNKLARVFLAPLEI
jgi:hypothetical protein